MQLHNILGIFTVNIRQDNGYVSYRIYVVYTSYITMGLCSSRSWSFSCWGASVSPFGAPASGSSVWEASGAYVGCVSVGSVARASFVGAFCSEESSAPESDPG